MRNSGRLRNATVIATVLLATLIGASSPPDAAFTGGVPSLEGATGWLNSPGIAANDLQGKVVLVDFWDYTCVNCLRTLPYLKALYDRYRDDGFVLVSVHSPTFSFAEEKTNVAAAVARLGVTWPVALDGRRAISHRFHNEFWPHEFLFDQTGKLVENVNGEGNYQITETNVQTLLHRTNPSLAFPPVMALLPQDNYAKPGAVCYPRSPDILVATTPIANPPPATSISTQDRMFYDVQSGHREGSLYLDGLWDLERIDAVSESGAGYAALAYKAIQVVGVLTPENGKSVRVDVTQDGAPLARADAGGDIRFDAVGKTYVTVDQPRAYELVMNAKYAAHELVLHPTDRGVGIYEFAFESCEVPVAQ